MTTDFLPDVGLGTWQNTGEQCTESVRTALDVGYRHVDTAERYGNEKRVGRALAESSVPREDVVVATKVHGSNLAYDDVLDSVEGSRGRLGVETIDLLYVHWPRRAYDPAATLAAFERLHERGAIGRVGLSNFTPDLLADARDRLSIPVAAHQVEMHPFLPQEGLLADAREHDTRLVAYAPLARGAVLDHPVIAEIARGHDATAAQVSLAWLLSKGVTVVPKATSEAHVRENFEARDVELDRRAIRRIDEIDRRERLYDPSDAPWNRPE